MESGQPIKEEASQSKEKVPKAIAPPATPPATKIEDRIARNKDDRGLDKSRHERDKETKEQEQEYKASGSQDRRLGPIRDKTVSSKSVDKTLDDLIRTMHNEEKEGPRFGSRRLEKVEEPMPKRRPSQPLQSQEHVVSSGQALGSSPASPCESA